MMKTQKESLSQDEMMARTNKVLAVLRDLQPVDAYGIITRLQESMEHAMKEMGISVIRIEKKEEK